MTDELHWFVKVGERYVHYEQFSIYVKHCFADHENDIMGWDLIRTQFHDDVKRRSDKDGWDEEDCDALDKMVDELLSCPVCKEVPMYSKKWYCTKCQRQMTLKDVGNSLRELKRSTGIEHGLKWED